MNNRDADITRAAILAVLPASQRQIIERTGLAKSTVSRHTTALHFNREIRIAEWGKPTGPGRYIAIFSVGSKPDAICKFQPIPENVRAKKMRALRKRTGENEDFEARRRARYYADHATYQRDPLLAAFFGAPA